MDDLDAGQDRLPFSPAVGCIVAIVLGALAAFLLFQVSRLVIQGEVRFGAHPLQPSRIWIVREDTRQGLGFELSSTVDGGLDQPTICRRSRVLFLLWRAEPDTARALDFCDCYRADTAGWTDAGACLDSP